MSMMTRRRQHERQRAALSNGKIDLHATLQITYDRLRCRQAVVGGTQDVSCSKCEWGSRLYNNCRNGPRVEGFSAGNLTKIEFDRWW